MKNILLFILFLCASYVCSAQEFVPVRFQEHLDLSERLLTEQPSLKQVRQWLPAGYTLDTVPDPEYRYQIKDATGKILLVQLHINTYKIVYIELSENKDWYRYLQKYLENKKQYTYMGSEHNCDYWNNKKLSVVFCPMIEHLQVHISLYDL